ncbi:class I SAM-dependent methyltransferase [Rubrivirga marina]|uniref:SAM-dependent methyltransferase n=1 Tax=Rubrivirga marina TaxID=1196024 RepID=A0A271J3N2_9BACT|nr:class I SAM-dependent methyltransferase [Rubrivirga marina]PAP78053.1 SAM-dependent methyltransferase [Rubrivirga marina]
MQVLDSVRALPADVPDQGFPCRSCGTPLRYSMVDLGSSPPCQNVVRPEELMQGETYYPLHAFVCHECSLVQIDEVVPPEAIFEGEYAYFSSYSDSWVAHAERYVAAVAERFGLGTDSLMVEVASNDGYLLQHAVARGIPCLGVEPAANVAEAARAKGVPTRVAFFGEDEARAMRAEGLRADVIAANNVLAHTPHLNSFVAGLAVLLADAGVVTAEFPHLVRLVDHNQFDTIYHEHFSYLSFTAVERVFERHGLVLFDVEELPTHGGSLRIYARHAADASKPLTARAIELRAREQAWGVDDLATYARFAEQVRETKRGLLDFLIRARRDGKTVVGYGAPGKGNTLLNYCGIRTDLLDYTVDRNPYKQGTYTPGARIPVHAPERIFETRPDYVLILPWNLRDEISAQMAGIREWGGQFVVPIPEIEVF